MAQARPRGAQRDRVAPGGAARRRRRPTSTPALARRAAAAPGAPPRAPTSPPSGSIRRARPAARRARCTRTPTRTGPPSSTASRVLALDARDDVCFSAAKLFFAYGLGNALTFPLCVGATVAADGRAAHARCGLQALDRQAARSPRCSSARRPATPACWPRPTLPARDEVALRLCSSAGEALPREIGERFTAHFGCEIIDGIGSTEMLHIFLSNRPGDVRYGTTGRPVPGYEIELRGDDGRPVRRRRDRRPLHPAARARR